MNKNWKRPATAVLAITITLVGFQNCSDFSVANSFGISSLFSASTSSVGQIRRLSGYEYSNSLNDILTAQFGMQNPGNAWKGGGIYGDSPVQNSMSALPSDAVATKLGTPELAMDLNEDFFSGYNNVAVAAASDIISQGWLTDFTGCATDATTMTPACVDQFITQFGTLAFRTPPTADERADLKTATDWTTLIAKILTHPRFLTHIERDGSLQQDGSYKLTQYEIEARLAQMFLKSAPDEAGLQAVANGSLATPAGIRAEAARMFATQRSHDVMWTFFQQWLGAKRVPYSYGADDPAYDTFSAPLANGDINAYPTALRNAVLQDAQQYLDYLTFNSGSLQDIFRSPLIFTTNSMVATLYGITPRASATAPPVTDTSGHYGGILSRQIITHQNPGTEGDTNHIQRGVLILSNLVGMDLGVPAAGALQQAAAANIPAGVSTRIEQVMQTSSSACQQCHQTINPVGFAMAHFDSLGRYKTTETRYRVVNGAMSVLATNSIDATAFVQLGSKFYPVSDLPDLVNALFDSGKLYEGFAKYYFMFAFGRLPASPNDLQLLAFLEGDLKTKSLSDALINMSQSPAFAIAVPPRGGQ